MERIFKERVGAMKPRPYQLKLLEYVVKRNAIIYLPTGAGKTHVAIMALQRMSHLMRQSISNGGKRAIFMCNTVELTRQQAAQVKKYTNLRVGLYVGERDSDNWTRRAWDDELIENQVLVGTAQIFVDMISQRTIHITDLCCVVIDECHHAKKHHPMHEFLRTFELYDPKMLPRVIGLTGVLLKGNSSNIRKDLAALEATFRGNIITVNSCEEFQNVMVYSTKPIEKVAVYVNNSDAFELELQIRKSVEDFCKIVDEYDIGPTKRKISKALGVERDPLKKYFIKNLFADFLYQMHDMGPYAATIAIASLLIEFEIKVFQSDTMAVRNLYRAAVCCCEQICHYINSVVTQGYDSIDLEVPSDANFDILFKYSTPKLRSLLGYLTATMKTKKKSEICCLVFAERRYTVKCLYYLLLRYLKLVPPLDEILSPDFMVGRNAIAPTIESRLDKRSKQAIENFRSRQCNMLVCSSVLQEGIDIQACNYVLVYDQLTTFNSYIQTKGRARSPNSFYILFIAADLRSEYVLQIGEYLEMQEDIRNYLMSRMVEREDPKATATAKQFVDAMKPYTVKSGAVLLASSTLQVLHRYCQMLPGDAFGTLMPWFSETKSKYKGKLAVSLRLPLQSTIRETIISEDKTSIKAAKLSVAFKACKLLYEKGELNEHLLPITKRQCVANIADDFFNHWKTYNDDVTNKKLGKCNRRLYDCKCPDELFGAMPIAGQRSYIYVLNYRPQFDENEYNSHIYHQLRTPQSYGICLSKPLPRLAEMPLYMNQGKLYVAVVDEAIELYFNEEELKTLQNFHYTIFRDLLGAWKPCFIEDQRNEENSYMLVPVKERKIDWTLVQNPPKPFNSLDLSAHARLRKIHNPEDYLGSLICKWNSNHEERFVVTKIRNDLSPLSQIGDDCEETFKAYFEYRHGHHIGCIVQEEQFLVEVRQYTTRKNFFINAYGKEAQITKKSQKTILLPELCHNFEFPASMYLKAMFLPNIMQRVYYMLHAEYLRRTINNFLGVANDENYRPKPLYTDASLQRALGNDSSEYSTEEGGKLAKWHNKTAILKVNSLDGSKSSAQNFSTVWSHKDDVTPQSNFVAEPFEERPLQTLERSVEGSVKTAEQSDFMAAITTAGACDVFDMERFELLGDSFLKLSAAMYLMNKYTQWHEGFLTTVKSKMVSNRNLLYCMLGTDIPQRISNYLYNSSCHVLPPLTCLPYNLQEWMRENPSDAAHVNLSDLNELTLTETERASGNITSRKLFAFLKYCRSRNKEGKMGKGKSGQNRDQIKNELRLDNDFNKYIQKVCMVDKVVADTLEAILGVCIKNYGVHNGFRMLEFFGICPPDPQQPISTLMDLKLESPLLCVNTRSTEVDAFLGDYRTLEANLGYTFKHRGYLLQALTHPSFPTNRLTGCYQELEFLGDAILDFLVSSYVFETQEKMAPGKLTDLRSSLVNNVTLACVCVRHKFHHFLLAENQCLAEKIRNFARFQETQNHRVTAQVRILMEEPDLNEPFDEENDCYVDEMCKKSAAKFNLSMNIDVPKALGDVLEALIAAVYLDSRDIQLTWKIVYRLLHQELQEFSREIPIDAVRQLCEAKDARPHFSMATLDSDIIMVKCTFYKNGRLKEVSGFGVNNKQAKKSAAKHALRILGQSPQLSSQDVSKYGNYSKTEIFNKIRAF